MDIVKITRQILRFIRKETAPNLDNAKLLLGKQIIVIEAAGYCPYCEKFRADVVKDYFGDIPLAFRLASQLEGLEIKSPTWATPTILFLEDGKEAFGFQGYLSPKEFYQALGYFKLGDKVKPTKLLSRREQTQGFAKNMKSLKILQMAFL